MTKEWGELNANWHLEALLVHSTCRFGLPMSHLDRFDHSSPIVAELIFFWTIFNNKFCPFFDDMSWYVGIYLKIRLNRICNPIVERVWRTTAILNTINIFTAFTLVFVFVVTLEQKLVFDVFLFVCVRVVVQYRKFQTHFAWHNSYWSLGFYTL
jgi:hypothetical protein